MKNHSKQMQRHAGCNTGIMETENHFKNGAGMKNRTGRGKLFMAAMLMCFWLGTTVAFADDSGSCGPNVTYKYTSADKTLTISGIGVMKDYYDRDLNDDFVTAPWANYRTEIENVKIENGVTRIGRYAFYGCSNLWGFTANNSSVTSIGVYAFYGCVKLQLPDLDNLFSGLETIGDYAFAECKGLKNIHLLNNITSVGEYAFLNCTGDTLLRIGSSVTVIGAEAFSGCTSLKNVIIEDGISNLTCEIILYNGAYQTFRYCPIENLYIGRNLLYLFDFTPFYDHKEIKNVTIGNQVDYLGYYLFSRCTGIDSITNNATTPQTVDDDVFNGVNKQTCKLIVPAQSLSAYKSANVWKDFFNILDGVEDVLSGQFAVYPNPARDEIFIKSDLAVQRIVIYDISGRIVEIHNAASLQQNGGVKTVNVSSLPKGIYPVQIHTGRGVVTKKIIKE